MSVKKLSLILPIGAAALLQAAPPCSAAFIETPIVSDGFVPAPLTDSDLKNPWGIAYGPTGPFWIANNNSGFSTIYDANGNTKLAPVTVPPPGGSPSGTTATPTGIVFNGGSGFQVGTNQPAAFIFSTEDGTISGWNFNANKAQALLKVDNSANAVYKGLAIDPVQNLIYATNFKQGRVDVFDQNFKPARLSGNFSDPNLPAPAAGKPGFAPFGIQNINGNIYVTYALQNSAQHDDVEAPGNGFVDIFNTQGVFQRRLISGGQLDSPWGMTLAPSGFGNFGGDLLVGNFGNSHVNVFDPNTGTLIGTLDDAKGNPLSLSDASDAKGLWGLKFGNGGTAGSPNTLFFTSGVNAESDGLFGSVSPSAVPLPEPGYLGLVGISGLWATNLVIRRVRRPAAARV